MTPRAGVFGFVLVLAKAGFISFVKVERGAGERIVGKIKITKIILILLFCFISWADENPDLVKTFEDNADSINQKLKTTQTKEYKKNVPKSLEVKVNEDAN